MLFKTFILFMAIIIFNNQHSYTQLLEISFKTKMETCVDKNCSAKSKKKIKARKEVMLMSYEDSINGLFFIEVKDPKSGKTYYLEIDDSYLENSKAFMKMVEKDAFEHAKKTNIRSVYVSFLSRFPKSEYQNEINDLRWSVRFQDAAKRKDIKELRELLDKDYYRIDVEEKNELRITLCNLYFEKFTSAKKYLVDPNNYYFYKCLREAPNKDQLAIICKMEGEALLAQKDVPNNYYLNYNLRCAKDPAYEQVMEQKSLIQESRNRSSRLQSDVVDYKLAISVNNEQGYINYLAKHPDGKYVTNVIQKIKHYKVIQLKKPYFISKSELGRILSPRIMAGVTTTYSIGIDNAFRNRIRAFAGESTIIAGPYTYYKNKQRMEFELARITVKEGKPILVLGRGRAGLKGITLEPGTFIFNFIY
jgi:hypothetical protein